MYRTGGGSEGGCPRCRDALADRTVDVGALGLGVLGVCATCGGVFADRAVTTKIERHLDRLLLALAHDAEQNARGPAAGGPDVDLPCPRCLLPMARERVEAAVCEIDRCAEHGTWFDAGELARIARVNDRRKSRGFAPPTSFGGRGSIPGESGVAPDESTLTDLDEIAEGRRPSSLVDLVLAIFQGKRVR